jgi:hypothetical protein
MATSASSYAIPSGIPVGFGTDGPAGLPFLSTLEPSPWFVGWALLLTAGLLALGVRVFSKRDL